MPQEQVLEVWGDLACFTRPELKVERFSYPVITPSAARGIYDAIYCKRTEFRWQITRIDILAYPHYIALRRNEVKDKISIKSVQRWMEQKEEPQPLIADGTPEELGTDQKGRTQRQTMALKNVHYYLYAHVHPWPGFEHNLIALEAQFRRRASHGKCIYQPYFGCREFPAYFQLLDIDINNKPEKSIPVNMDIGLMLYDVFDLSVPGKPLDTEINDSPYISLFRAEIKNNVMIVPDYDSEWVLKGRSN